MKLHGLFKEYIWIINSVYRSREISLKEINERWIRTDMSGGLEFSRLSFYRHRKGIEDNFGICIECNHSTNKYYISNQSVMDESSMQNWMLNTLSVNNIISDSIALDKMILMEPVSGSNETLETIVKAMKKQKKISVTYKRYGADASTSFMAEPYCVKLWNKRWYALLHHGTSDNGFLGMYSVDRITDITLTQEGFTTPSDFDALRHFRDSFGVMVSDRIEAERIVLRAFGNQVYNLRDLPLHHSQKEINTAADYSDFEYLIQPTYDFISAILACRAKVKVIHPLHLAEKIKNELKEIMKLY